MKRYLVIAAALVALAIPASALAVGLHEAHIGSTCGDSTGTWHFVANQVGGLKPKGTLTANFSSGTVVATADHVTAGSQHWTIEAAGTLNGASATVGGKLVLSDFVCEKKDDKK